MGTDGLRDSIVAALAAAGPNAVMVLRPIFDSDGTVDGEFVWCNEVALALEPSLRVGTRASSLFPRSLDAVPSTAAGLAAWADPGVTKHTAPFSLRVGDTTKWFEAAAVRTGDLVTLTFVDRTDELASRQQAEASDGRFRELLARLEAGVVLLRPVWHTTDHDQPFLDAEIVWANEASGRMWRNQEGLAAGTRVRDVYYDLDEWLQAANAAWRGEPQTRMLTPDPEVALWTSATESLRRLDDLIVEFTFDRTNDQQLLEQIEQLDQRFQSLIEDLPLTVMVLRLDSAEIEFVSPNAAQLTGIPLNELTRLSTWDELIVEDDRNFRLELATALMSDRRSHETHWRFRRRTGEVIHVSIRAVRRTYAGVDQIVALVADITEQRRILERLAVSDRLETLGRTAGSIAHDFNNLLMIANGNIDRARTRFNQPPELEAAAVATTRAARLANSLLAFASGRPGEPRELSLRAVFDQIRPILRGSLPDTAVMRVDIDEHLPTIWADASHLEQVFVNLVANSRIAMGDHGTLTITARTVTSCQCHLHQADHLDATEWVLLELSDTGVGIPRELIPRVWEPFFTTRRNEPDMGAGLGMSTVHGIVHQYGGHVLLDSEQGVGTTVSAYFPVFRRAS